MADLTGAMPNPPPLLVDAREAARRLSIGSRKLWEMTNCGELPVVRVGRLLRYRPSDLEAWVEQQVTRGRRRGDG